MPRFAILGSLDIRHATEPIPVNGTLQRRILAVLLLEAGRVVPVSRLVEVAWDDDPPESAAHQVRKTVAKLRHRIPHGPEIIVTDGPGYRAVVDAAQLDLLRFRELLRHAREFLEAADEEQAIDHLGLALALWRGPVLAGDGGPVIDAASTALGEQRLASIEQLYELRLKSGQAAELTGELRALVDEHPLRETLRVQLMLALYHSGRQAAALEEFSRARDHLAEELGIDPGSELTDLHERILRHDPSLARPERARSRAPAPAGADLAPETPHVLPFDVPDFSGRAAELTRIRATAGRSPAGTPTVLAIDGMGGGGKTALAVRVAHELAGDYPGGTLFVDLKGFTPGQEPLSPFHAQGDLLAAAGIPGSEVPAVPAGRSALWQSYMRGRRMLLVLDNAAASEQVRALIPASSDCLVLVTSRPRLTGLEGAEWLSLGALPEDDSHELLCNALGRERVRREPKASVELLQLCGGLPLAVRIAAARLANRPQWTVQRLVERLRDHGRRLDELTSEDRGVASALMLSYQAMPQQQRTAFRLLGYHPGRYLDADEAAALLGVGRLDAEDVLEGMVDVRLLEAREPGVYAFHDLVRSFVHRVAQSESAQEDEPAVERLLDHYLNTAEHACDALFPGRRRFGGTDETPSPLRGGWGITEFPTKEAALQWLDQHRDSLLPAVELAYQKGHLRHAARLPRELGFHSSVRGYDAIANVALEQGVRASRELDDRPLIRLNLMNLAMGLWRLGRLQDAVASLEQALELAHLMEDLQSEAECKARLGQAYNSLGELDRAARLSEEANRIARETGFVRLHGSSLSTLSQVQVRRGDFEQAAGSARQALDVFDSIGEVQLTVDALTYLSQASEGSGRFEEALDHIDTALERCRGLRMRSVLPLVLARQTGLLVRMNRIDEAVRSATHALAEATRSTNDVHHAAVHLAAGRALHAADDFTEALGQYRQAHEIACRMEMKYDMACAVDGLAHTAEALGDVAAAAEQHRAAEALFSRIGVPRSVRCASFTPSS
ncbi:transcriptional regulator [Streptomyces triticagri]|uniref:Transcriptional regulator n=1 Tax=Streptomyces triticagri TaxID=2293568 RepID=A0A372M2Q6_9ACTN|nr:BTAD domain-containing putative transcriptional regulator [Streptomyces triticagri]RFU85214.1 transcriptional regulator [Streptomyces triticagri]